MHNSEEPPRVGAKNLAAGLAKGVARGCSLCPVVIGDGSGATVAVLLLLAGSSDQHVALDARTCVG